MTIFDTHVHTSQVSKCSRITGKELARLYKKAGYDGIVITDHIVYYYWKEAMAQNMSWEAFARNHMEGFLAAKAEGDKIGLKVHYGCELRFNDNSDNDYLVYGMTNDFLVSNPDVMEWGIKKFSEIAEKNGFLVFQAHPFRNNMVVKNPEYLFGVEVHNGNPHKEHFERNAFANLWAERFNLKKIAGSDCHMPEQAARAGLCFYKDVSTEEDFVREVKAQNYMLLENPNPSYTDLTVFD